MKAQELIVFGLFATAALAGSEVVKRSQVQKLEQRAPEVPVAKRAAEPNLPRSQPWRKDWERSEEGEDVDDFIGSGSKVSYALGENHSGRQLWHLDNKEVFTSLLKAVAKA